MNNLSVMNLQHIYMGQKQAQTFNNINYRKNSHGDIFIKSSPSFQGNMAQKSVEVVAKNKKGFWLAIASLLGINITTAVGSTNKAKVKESPVVVTEEKVVIPRRVEYTQDELDGIVAWERTNNDGQQFIKLRDILRHKENHSSKDSLTKDEVMLLADYLVEETKILSTYLKSHPKCSPRELMELRKMDKEAPRYYLDVAKYCPYANVDEYKKIAKNFNSLWARERQAVMNFSRQRELIQKMEQLQKTKPDDYMLEIYFSEYRFTFPAKDRAKLDDISIKTTKASELPTMSVDDLVKRLEYLKTPEGKTEHLKR